MDALKQFSIDELQTARAELLDIPKDSLTYTAIDNWRERWNDTFDRADTISMSAPIGMNIERKLQGYQSVHNTDIFNAIRLRLIDILDWTIQALDSQQTVRPLLDDYISKVQDTQLCTLLKQFNTVRESAPDLAAMSFRTILCL